MKQKGRSRLGSRSRIGVASWQRITAWLLLVTGCLQLLPLRPLQAQEAFLEGDSFNFRESSPTALASGVALGQGNAMKVREAPVSATGAFETSVAIDVPPGRAGMTPELSLSYSSDAFRSDSPVGAGFSLNVPSISRSTSGGFPPLVSVAGVRSYANDVSLTPALAGRVLFTSPSGDLAPADAPAAPASLGTLFLPQREQSPVRYELIEAEDRWVEHLPSGRKRFYGASSSGAAPARVVNELGTHRWLLVEERDADGNHIDYAYHDIDEQARPDRFAVQAVPVLSEVLWGGNDAASIAPLFRLTTTVTDYENGPVDMLDGHVVLTRRLTLLSVFGPGPSGAETEYWHYELDATPSEDSRRQLLRSVSRISTDGSPPLITSFQYSGNQGAIAFEEPVALPESLDGVYVAQAEQADLIALGRFFSSNASLTPLGRPQGYQFLDHDADGDTDILYHPAGLKTPAAVIQGADSFESSPGAAPLPSFTGFGADTGYRPQLFVKNLADVDGDRDLDAIAFRVDIQHNRQGEPEVISRGTFEEPQDFTADVLCSLRGAGDRQDVGSIGGGFGSIGRVACPDPLPPDLQIDAPDLPFDLPDIFPDVVDPLNPFGGIINPPDPLGSAPLLDLVTRRSVAFGDAELLLATSFPSGSFVDVAPDDITRLIDAQALGPTLPTVSLTIPSELAPSRVLLGATNGLVVLDRTNLIGFGTELSCVVNLGTALTDLGPSVQVGEIWSAAPLLLRGAIVDGNVRALAGVEQLAGATIAGSIDATAFASAATSLEFAFRAPQGNVDVASGSTLALPPGSYGDLIVRTGSELRLDAGQYDVDALSIEPGAQVIFQQPAGATSLFARESVSFGGDFSRDDGTEPDVLVVFPGSGDVVVEAPFSGTLLAPNARIVLPTVTGEHVGAFFAQSIEAQPDLILRHRPFPFELLPNARELPVDFRVDRVEDLVVRAPQLSNGPNLRLIDVQLDPALLELAEARFQASRDKNPIPSEVFDFADTALVTRDTGLIADVTNVVPISQEVLDNAKAFLCDDLCNGGDGFFACMESLGGFGNAWLQSDAAVPQFGALPTLSDQALIGTVGHFAGSPVDIGVDFGGVTTGSLPNVCSAAPISMACVGMMLLCDDPNKCDDVSASAPTTSAVIEISEYSKQRVDDNPENDPALSSVVDDDVLIRGWPRSARQVVSVRSECGMDAALVAEPEHDFQAPFIDIDADGRADVVLLKSMKRVGDDFTFLSIGRAFINRLKERREFTLDRSADHDNASAFSESLVGLMAPGTEDLLPCIPGHTSFSGNNDLCDQSLAFPLGIDFLSMPVDLNTDGLPDMVLARPPGSGLPEVLAGKPCLAGNLFHVNRGYAWEAREDVFTERTLPGLFPPRLFGLLGEAPGVIGPLELLRNRSRACTGNLIETSLGDELPPEAMRLADLDADGRTDVLFSVADLTGALQQALFENTGRDFVPAPVPLGVGLFAVVSGGFGPVLSGDLQRFVDLDNDGLTDILQAGMCQFGDCSPAQLIRHAGVVPDLLTQVTSNTGSVATVAYVAATSGAAQAAGVIINGGRLPAGKMVVSQITRAAGPADAAWAGFGPNAVESIRLSYENFVREQGNARALGFERVTALFENSLPGGAVLESAQTTRVFDVSPEVALSGGGVAAVPHPLRGSVRETITTSGTTRVRQVRQFFLAALAAGSVLVRPSLEQRELCEADTCISTARVSSGFDSFGYPSSIQAGNFAGASLTADVDLIQVQRSYEHRQDLWKLGLPTSETLLGQSEDIAGTAAAAGVLGSEQTSYDALGRAALVTRALSDGAGPCAAFPAASTRTTAYTAFGLPAVITENGNRTTSTVYDATGLYAAGNSVAVADASGAPTLTLSESFVFDPRFGQLTSRTDANGQTFVRSLDARGRTLLVTGPGGVTLQQSTFVDATATTPNLITTLEQIDPGKAYTVSSFSDGGGHVLAEVEQVAGRAAPFVRRQRSLFDAFGRRVSNVQPRPASSATDVAIAAGESTDGSVYDGFDRLRSVQQAGRGPVLIDYPVTTGARPGSVVRRQNPGGTVSSSLLNARGEVVALSLESAAGEALGTTQLLRDGAGRVLRVVDADGLERSLSYDIGGRIEQVTLPHQAGASSVASTACHDADGLLVFRTTASGRQTTVTRDNLGRQTQVSQSFEGELRTHAYGYDAALGLGLGRLTSLSDDGGSYRFEYDEFGRVELTEYTLSPLLASDVPPPAGPTLVIVDDFTLQGQLDRRETNGLGVAPLVIDLELDDKGAVIAVSALDAAFPGGRSLIESVGYDAFDRPAAIELGNGSSIQRSYEPVTQRPSALVHAAAEPFAELLLSAYDANDNLLLEQRTAAGQALVTKTHGYDALDRLVASSVDFGGEAEQQAFGYSLGGNLQSSPAGTYAYGLAANGQAVTQITGATLTRSLAYDADGQLRSDVTTDGSGAEERVLSRTLTPDASGCLEAVSAQETLAGVLTASITTRHVCNADGQRIARDVTDELSGVRQRVIFLPGGLELRPDDAGGSQLLQRVQLSELAVAEIAWSTTSGEPIAASSGYLHTDLRGSILAKSALDDAATNFLERADYTAFGETLSFAGELVPQRQFAATEPDPLTGEYRFGLRSYDPLLARFGSPDPVAWVDPGAFQHDPQQLNLYAYARNNPVTATDRRGGIAETVWDVANIAIGVVSLVDNIKQGNVLAAVVDGAGVLVDTAAAVVPVLPGGAGAAIKAARGGERAVELALDTVTTGDRVLDAARAANASSGVAEAAGATARASTIQANRAAGVAAEEVAVRQLMEEGNSVLGRQVSVRTSMGLRRVDVLVQTPEGQLLAVEVKSGNATRSATQLAKDTLIATEGGLFLGKNAPDGIKGEVLVVETVERVIQ